MENQNSQNSTIEVSSTVSPVPNSPHPPHGKSKFSRAIIIGIVLLLLLAASAVGFYVFKPQIMNLVSKHSLTPSPSVQKPSPTPDPTSSWKTYTNTKFGFTFKYPISAISYQADCIKNEFGFRNIAGVVPITIIENGNTVTIARKYFYDVGQDYKNVNNVTYYSKCEKTESSSGMGNFIKAGIAKNDKDIDTFIKDNFEKTCSINKKEPSYTYNWSNAPRQETAFSITTKNEKGEVGGADNNVCSTFGPILYYPEKDLVLYFKYGQDCALSDEKNQCYSGIIGDSLKPL